MVQKGEEVDWDMQWREREGKSSCIPTEGLYSCIRAQGQDHAQRSREAWGRNDSAGEAGLTG